jgi:hypothetical protein
MNSPEAAALTVAIARFSCAEISYQVVTTSAA